MKLSKRLRAIYELVSPSAAVADIGCDHALLPIALVSGKKCSRAYACDVNTGPLSRAQEAIVRHGMQDKVFPILCDGLAKVPQDAEVLIIAGMGFDTIKMILQQGMKKAKAARQLILQANNHVEELRRWLHANGFAIEREVIVKERHFYHLLSVHYGQQELEEDALFFGLCDDEKMFLEYLCFLYQKQQQILDRMPLAHPKRKELEHALADIERKKAEIAAK